MNELDIKVINTVPAQVDFNFEEISKHLDGVLKHYEGILVTEDTLRDGKKVIADLRKGKKSLDEFRKKTKKELTKSVTEFEDKCKELGKKFDEVIDPIVNQAERFEEKRKEEKRMEVEKIIDEVCKLKKIETLALDERYLNKSMSLKAIQEDLIRVADEILLEKANRDKDISLIEGRIDLANAKYGVTMIKKPYVSMLEYEEIDNILNKILEDGESLKNKLNAKPKVQAPINKPSIDEEKEIFIDNYEVEGTEVQLDTLENFLNTNGYKWCIKTAETED